MAATRTTQLETPAENQTPAEPAFETPQTSVEAPQPTTSKTNTQAIILYDQQTSDIALIKNVESDSDYEYNS